MPTKQTAAGVISGGRHLDEARGHGRGEALSDQSFGATSGLG
jgi:hypothetical protein